MIKTDKDGIRWFYRGNMRYQLSDGEDEPRTNNYKEYKCCNEWFYCGGFTNTCPECGADYNWAGDLLAPREQWGEETGETAADIIRPLTPDEEMFGVDY